MLSRALKLVTRVSALQASTSSATFSGFRVPAFKRMTSSATEMQPFDVLLFDLDGCLYDADCGYVQHQRKNLFGKFVSQHNLPVISLS